MAEHVGVSSTEWLDDPVAIRVGPKTVALVLVLAARVLAERPTERSVVIALDVWSCYFDKLETDRVVAAGLVEPLLVGRRPVAFRVASWVRSRIDTDRKIRTRTQTRDRVRRLRQRRQEQPSLDLWMDCAKPANVPEPDDSVTCVTNDPTTDQGSISARAEVRTTYLADLFGSTFVADQERNSAHTTDPVENPDERKTFRLVMALVVHVRRPRPDWIHPTSSRDRQDLVDAVRVAAERAHLPTTTREIRRAIRYVERTEPDLSSARTGDRR